VWEDVPSADKTLPVLQDTASQQDPLMGYYGLVSTYSLSFPVAIAAESPTLSTARISLSLNGSTFLYAAPAAAPAVAPTLYKMRAYQTGAGIFEYWTSSGTPQLTNPSGLSIAAGSLSVVAMKRPTQLVV